VPPNEVRIIAISDEALPEWRQELVLAPMQIGEITVAGPSATDEYFRRPQATALAKIRERDADGAERIVHRMGDLGYFDGEGRLWFCGRKSHRVRSEYGSLFTEQVEPVFNRHPEVRRSALVGVGDPGHQRPVLCVELRPGVRADQHERIAEELLKLGQGFVHTGRVETFLFHRKFPLDIRHNAKIGRELLAAWATRQLRAKR
jgi:acyl-CoA synthetase (AMP-forming)/AMP-acid ligase II